MQRRVWGIAGASLVLAITVAGCGTNQPNQMGQNQSNNNTTAKTNSSSTNNSKAQPITIGYVNWDEDVAATYLWKYLLEQKGYQVNLKSLSPGPIWEGLSTGGLDVFFDDWMPYVDKPYMIKYGSHIATLHQWYGGVTKEGFVVPDYVKNVKTMAGLRAFAKKVNGRIIGIEAGSSEMGQAKQALSTYNLPYQLVSSSTPAMLSALQRAYQQHKPIVVTLWSPHWAFTKYKLHYIEDPKQIFGKPGIIETAANKTWASNNLQVVSWFNQFHLSKQQLGTLEEDIAAQKGNPTAGVKKWASANQTLINSWFS